MKCILMHKRIAVAGMELDDATGFIQKIGMVYAPEHFPVGIPVKKGVADRTALNEWWTDRSIPTSRSGVREALEVLEITSTKLLLVRCYGLSLSDQYWICPKGSGLTWDAINFFDNGFSDDIGDVLFGADRKGDALKDGSERIGSRTRAKVVKNKMAPPFREAEFDVLYGKGISRTGELLDMAVKLDIVQKSGAWFSYNGNRLGQGRDNAREFLGTHKEISDEVEAGVKANVGKLFGKAKPAKGSAAKPVEVAVEPPTPEAAEGKTRASAAADIDIVVDDDE